MKIFTIFVKQRPLLVFKITNCSLKSISSANTIIDVYLLSAEIKFDSLKCLLASVFKESIFSFILAISSSDF